MKANVGGKDKVVRIIAALLIGVLIFAEVITGTLAIVFGIAAVALVLTSLFSFCGLYVLFGVTTCKRS